MEEGVTEAKYMTKPKNQQSGSVAKPDLKVVEGGDGTRLVEGKVVLGNGKQANAEALASAAKILGVAAAKGRGAANTRQLLGAVRIEVAKRLATIPEDDHVLCTACGEVSTKDTDFCPFCGDMCEEAPELEAAQSVGISSKPLVAPKKSVAAAMEVVEQKLADRIESINRLKSDATKCSYDIGLVCKEIRDEQLFKSRGD